MKTIDNFLKQDDFIRLSKVLLDTKFPWYYNDSKSNNSDNNFQFVHIFYWEDKILSPFWNYIAPILDKLNAKKIIRVKANLTTRKNKNYKSLMHIDTKIKNSKTAVFYTNTNNGSTVFESGEIVYSKENRIALFDSDKKHCGADCTNELIRIVINFNYLD
jgi:hypothetical protein|tara:strand:- start:976 stop:1455 length:480 start_codon:yes stop_codon:yes gene_type:complete